MFCCFVAWEDTANRVSAVKLQIKTQKILAKWCSKNYHRRQLHSARILLREASARGIGCTALRRGKQHRSAWPSSYLAQRLATTPLLAARTGSKRRLQQATTVSLLGRTPWSGASTKERRKIGPSAGATDVAGQAYERKRAQTWAQRTLPEDPTQPIDEVRQHRREFLIHELPTFGGYCSHSERDAPISGRWWQLRRIQSARCRSSGARNTPTYASKPARLPAPYPVVSASEHCGQSFQSTPLTLI